MARHALHHYVFSLRGPDHAGHLRDLLTALELSAPGLAPLGRWLSTLLLLGLVVACGQLPQPFQDENKAANPLLTLSDTASILVLPIESAGSLTPAATSEVLAEALREQNLAATTASAGQSSRHLASNAAVLALSPTRDELLLRLELIEADGTRIGLISQRDEIPSGAWQSGDPDTITQVTERAAASVAALIQRPAPKEALIPGFPGARFVVLPFTDLPGDGEVSLPRSLTYALKTAGFPVVEEVAEDDLVIAGAVDLEEGAPGAQLMTVTWRLMRANDGEVLGQIDQANQIPKGSLDGAWGPTSRAIAQGAAYGILDLIGQLGPA